MIPISRQLAVPPLPRSAELALIREYDPQGFRTWLLKKYAIDPLIPHLPSAEFFLDRFRGTPYKYFIAKL
jgi:hypothetical protein